MFRLNTKNRANKNPKLEKNIRNQMYYITRLIIVLVIISAYLVILFNAPSSSSYFTDRLESDSYNIEF